jgi:2-dehydropantoate 2-reductase
MPEAVRYTIVGAGGIGGLIGAWMARGGCDVTFVERWAEHAAAIDHDGLAITGSRGRHHVRVPAITTDGLADVAPLDTVVVAVKGHDTRAALEQLLPYAADDTLFVSMQAGENVHIFEEVVGRERTVAANPHFGGALVDPGHLEAGFPNYVWIGELDGRITPRLQRLQQDLLHWGPTHISDDILAVVWSKFCFGSQTVMTSITDRPSGQELETPRARLVAGELVREAISVAEGHGIELAAFDFFDPSPYVGATSDDASGLHFWIELAWPRHEVFRAHGFHTFVKTGSGMKWDLLYRKRKTETGARVRALRLAADRAGIAIPFNEALLDVVTGIERGDRPMHDDNIDDLGRVIGSAGGTLLTDSAADAPVRSSSRGG